MESSLEILARAFFESDPRVAVVDSETRKRVGLWLSEHTVPVGEIIATFSDSGRFQVEDHLVIPLHEINSAELTGTYVVCLHGDDTRVGFVDYSQQSPVFLPIDEFTQTVLALQLRYWHPAYRPAETPSYLAEYYSYHDEPEDTGAEIAPATSLVDEGFFEEVKLFIERERDAKRTEVREQYASLGSRSFIEAHAGIPSLEAAGRRIDDDGEQVCMLRVAENEVVLNNEGTVEDEFGVYPGNEVLIDSVEDHEGFPVEGEVLESEGDCIDFRIKWSTAANHGAAESGFSETSNTLFRVVPLLNPVPFDRQRKSVDVIEDDDRKRAIVLGTHSLRFNPDQSLGSRARALNQYQRRSIRRALGAQDVCCIHGPPGTGKTRTLRELIREAIAQGEKVLACAHSNQAIDHLLAGSSTRDQVDSASLHADAVGGEFVMKRAGSGSHHPVVNEYYQDVESWEANLVGSTANAAFEFRTDEFDLVVIDEAGQCGIPSTMIPFARGDRLVLAGDHRQLPPFTSSEADQEEQMEISLFEHVIDRYGSDVSSLLRKQYRMNEEIAAFPDQWFYDGKLTHGQRNRTWTLRDLDPLVAYQVSGTEARTPSGSYYNEREAEVVADEVRQLLQRGVPASQIGVITPYSGQVGKIVQALDDPALKNRVKISTVDSFQGSEREAIIVSFVRSNETGDTGFLTFPREGPRRLNVALTRAKKRLVLIGDWETLGSTPSHRSAGEDSSSVFTALKRHLTDRGVLRVNHPNAVS